MKVRDIICQNKLNKSLTDDIIEYKYIYMIRETIDKRDQQEYNESWNSVPMGFKLGGLKCQERC